MGDVTQKGVYVIINKPMKMVYVGYTHRTFMYAWARHLVGLCEKRLASSILNFYLSTDTLFLPVKHLETDSEKLYKEFREKAYDFYRERGWNVVYTASTDNEKLTKNHDLEQEQQLCKKIVQILRSYVGKKTLEENILYPTYSKIDLLHDTNLLERNYPDSPFETMNRAEITLFLEEVSKDFRIIQRSQFASLHE